MKIEKKVKNLIVPKKWSLFFLGERPRENPQHFFSKKLLHFKAITPIILFVKFLTLAQQK